MVHGSHVKDWMLVHPIIGITRMVVDWLLLIRMGFMNLTDLVIRNNHLKTLVYVLFVEITRIE